MTDSPKKKPKRTQTLKVRVTPAELVALRDRAGERDLAGWLRELGLGAPAHRSRPIAPIDPALLAAVGRVGNNLNQLARSANAAGQLPQLAALVAIQRELEAIRCTFAG